MIVAYEETRIPNNGRITCADCYDESDLAIAGRNVIPIDGAEAHDWWPGERLVCSTCRRYWDGGWEECSCGGRDVEHEWSNGIVGDAPCPTCSDEAIEEIVERLAARRKRAGA